ncbi:MAG: hypothetical protein AAF684_10830, partial [Pseudomonadota bacterium]
MKVRFIALALTLAAPLAQAQSDDPQAQIDALNAEIATLQAEIADLQAALAASEAEVARLSTDGAATATGALWAVAVRETPDDPRAPLGAELAAYPGE